MYVCIYICMYECIYIFVFIYFFHSYPSVSPCLSIYLSISLSIFLPLSHCFFPSPFLPPFLSLPPPLSLGQLLWGRAAPACRSLKLIIHDRVWFASFRRSDKQVWVPPPTPWPSTSGLAAPWERDLTLLVLLSLPLLKLLLLTYVESNVGVLFTIIGGHYLPLKPFSDVSSYTHFLSSLAVTMREKRELMAVRKIISRKSTPRISS